MPKSNLVKRVASVVILSVLLPMSAQANPCNSQWQSLGASFKTLAAIGERLFVCPITYIPEACVDRYEKAKQEIEVWKNTGNNVNTGPNHIGPRGCAPAHSYSGNVTAEQVFVCTPVVQKQWTLDLKLTGGKGKRPLKVDVCLVDHTGNAVRHFTQTFNGAKKNVGAKFNKTTYGKATGLTPVIYLHKQFGTRGYKYELKAGEKGGEPRAVEQARSQLAAKKKTSGKIK